MNRRQRLKQPSTRGGDGKSRPRATTATSAPKAPKATKRTPAGAAARRAAMAAVEATAAALGLLILILASPEMTAAAAVSGGRRDLASETGAATAAAAVGVREVGGAAAAAAAAAAGAAAAAEAIDTVLMVDAGSSGSRLNVYRLDGEGEALSFSATSAGKIEPGLNSFADSPADAGEHILPLLAKASELVPPEKHSTTKVFIKSTAGMRLLPTETQEAIYDSIYTTLVGNPSLFPFALDRRGVGTIDGEMEAFYAVLSANFLAGRIDARMHPTRNGSGEIGALDMGGASTQIIFRHEQDINSGYGSLETRSPASSASGPMTASTGKDNDTCRCDNSNHKDTSNSSSSSSSNCRNTNDSGPAADPVMTHDDDDDADGENDADGIDDDENVSLQQEGWGSGVGSVPVSQDDFWGASHLGYGAAEVRLRIWDFLVETHSDWSSSSAAAAAAAGHPDDLVVVNNPCSFVGRVDEWKGHRLVGSGDHVVCEEVVTAVLWGRGGGDADGSGDRCAAGAQQRPCGVGGVSMPPLRGDFLAMSVFFYATHALHALGPAGLLAWPRPTLTELREAAAGFCALGWATLQDRKDTVMAEDERFSTSEEGLPHRCVEVVYMTTLLRDGYGFPEHSRNVTYALEADGMELEWTLGYALVELARSKDAAEDTGNEPPLAVRAVVAEPQDDGKSAGSVLPAVLGGHGDTRNGRCSSNSAGGGGGGSKVGNYIEPCGGGGTNRLVAAAAAVFSNWKALWKQ